MGSSRGTGMDAAKALQAQADDALRLVDECIALLGWTPKALKAQVTREQVAAALRIEASMRGQLGAAWDAEADAVMNNLTLEIMQQPPGAIKSAPLLSMVQQHLGAQALGSTMQPIIDGHLRTAFTLGKKGMGYAAGTGVQDRFSLVDGAAQDWLVRDQLYWVGQYYGQHIGPEIAGRAQQVVVQQGLGRAEAAKQIKAALEPVVGPGRSDAYWHVVAAAGVTRSRAYGGVCALIEAGVTRYELVNPRDERTSEICNHLDGQVWEVRHAVAQQAAMLAASTPDEAKAAAPWLPAGQIVGRTPDELAAAGLGLPPYHGNCRTTVDVSEEDATATSREYAGASAADVLPADVLQQFTQRLDVGPLPIPDMTPVPVNPPTPQLPVSPDGMDENAFMTARSEQLWDGGKGMGWTDAWEQTQAEHKAWTTSKQLHPDLFNAYTNPNPPPPALKPVPAPKGKLPVDPSDYIPDPDDPNFDQAKAFQFYEDRMNQLIDDGYDGATAENMALKESEDWLYTKKLHSDLVQAKGAQMPLPTAPKPVAPLDLPVDPTMYSDDGEFTYARYLQLQKQGAGPGAAWKQAQAECDDWLQQGKLHPDLVASKKVTKAAPVPTPAPTQPVTVQTATPGTGYAIPAKPAKISPMQPAVTVNPAASKTTEHLPVNPARYGSDSDGKSDFICARHEQLVLQGMDDSRAWSTAAAECDDWHLSGKLHPDLMQLGVHKAVDVPASKVVTPREMLRTSTKRTKATGTSLPLDGPGVEDFDVNFRVEKVNGKKVTKIRFKVTQRQQADALMGMIDMKNSPDHYAFVEGALDSKRMVTKKGGYGASMSFRSNKATLQGGTTVEMVTEDGALKNFVEITVSGDSVDDAMDAWERVAGAMTIDGPSSLPSAKDIDRAKKAKLLSLFDRDAGATLAKGYIRDDALDDLFEQTLTYHPAMKAAYDDAELVQVSRGHTALFSKKLAAKLSRDGVGELYHDGGGRHLADMLADPDKAGLMASATRYHRGIFVNGMSTGTDFGTGGADGVFVRIAKKTDDAVKDGWGIRIHIDKKQLGRLDWYAFNGDNYGNTSEQYRRQRILASNLKDLCDPKAGRYGGLSGSNEVMFKHGVPVDAWTRISVSTAADKANLIVELQAKGVKKINGKALDVFIVARR